MRFAEAQRASLLVNSRCVQTLNLSEQGGSDGQCTAGSGFRLSGMVRRVCATVWPRFRVLVFAAIVCVGRHTICRLLRIAGELADGHWSSYHRVLSKRRWSIWRLARILAQHVIDRFVPRGTISISGDDTVTQHPGKKVYGKGRHRDAVRSTHSYTAWKWGHKWVVLAIQVQLPGLSRPWALPVLCTLYRTPKRTRSGAAATRRRAI